MADLVKNRHFFGSGMTCELVLFVNKNRLFFTKSAIKNTNPNVFHKILTCPNSLSVRAFTDVKSGQKFQLEPC